ncbi:MAG: hypothetical protein Q4P32_03265 [Micrococcales bacterium]|nr:hypothetical protein [Micrococcales bacterium]
MTSVHASAKRMARLGCATTTLDSTHTSAEFAEKSGVARWTVGRAIQ